MNGDQPPPQTTAHLSQSACTAAAPCAARFIAYRVIDRDVAIIPSPPMRDWMAQHPIKLAHACHPLLIANEAGWCVLSPCDVEAKWDGGPSTNALKLKCGHHRVVSNFGMGIVTWRLPYLFRTPPGWQLWVKGPANMIVDGAAPLEGVVEADHAVETFTMNWKLTRRGKVRWSTGDPICQLVPIQITAPTTWRPVIEIPPVDLQHAYDRWISRRMDDNRVVPYEPSLGYRRRAAIKRLLVKPFARTEED